MKFKGWRMVLQKATGLAKFLSDFTGVAVSFFLAVISVSQC